MSKNDAIAASLDHHYTEKDSPQPHVPLIFGLLKTNSEASLETKSIESEAQTYIQERVILALLKVHLRAKDGELGFLVNEDGHPILVHNLILGLFGLGIVKSVTQT